MVKYIKKLTGTLCILLYSAGTAAPYAVADDNTNRQKLSISEQRKFDYFYYEGVRLKNAAKYDASYEMFRRCLEIDSTSSVAMFDISSYYIQMNQPEKAVVLLRKTVACSPHNQEYRSTLATLLFNMSMFGEAAEEYELLIRAFPGKPELNYFLAEAYTRMGEIGKAIDAYNMLENSMGMHEAISMEKFQLYMTIEQPDSAFNELIRLAGKFPMESRYPVMIGDLYLQRDDTVQALKYFKQAWEMDPQSPYYPVSMANYYEKTGQKDAAKQQIQEALMNARLDVNTKMNILVRYIMQLQRSKQDIDGANTLFGTLLEQHPDEARLKLAYGDFLATQNKFDEARFQYRLVTESEPENIDAWQQLLRLSLQTQDLDEVLRICNKCQEIFPDAMEFRFYPGVAYYQKKEYQLAIDMYEAGLRFVPKDNQSLISDFYGQIGDTYFHLKETDKAFDAYEEALKYNDKNIVVLNNYAYYLSLLKKDLSKAERMSALCIKMEPDNAIYIDTYAWIFFVQGNYLLAKMYIEQALSKDKTNSAELVDHYGDILYLSGEKEKALEQWRKAKEQGKINATLDRKISEETYFEETAEELFNSIDEKDTGETQQ
ncbi:MAG: tetratricopeptide repeat protein [Bacteroidales bacterium]|jgi:tetratricopeptide (TPR) repeat protein|nr:tetratricopeptide repeat protein [Bacteroidales bacterium]